MAEIRRLRPIVTIDTPLGECPPEWLSLIEGKIMRGSFLPCWVWKAKTSPTGYPLMRCPVRNVDILARRFIFGLFYEYPSNWYVSQTCHHTTCVNPDHLICTQSPTRWLDDDARREARRALGGAVGVA